MSFANPLIDWPVLLAHPDIATLLKLSIAEDVGSGDVTTQAIFENPQHVEAHILTRTQTVVCGLPLAAHLFAQFDPHLQFSSHATEGQHLTAGHIVCTFAGDLRAILTAERTVLNFLMRLCGIASATAAAVAQIPNDTRAKIYDTRKTLPGWRLLDKAAVRAGGGQNHRMGLYDAVLIKDNHVAKAGSIEQAVQTGRAHAHGRWLELEIDSLAQLDQALVAKPDIILLDNFSLQDMAQAVLKIGGAAQTEASGGITLARLADIARTGVDRISMGALTHTVVPADLSLEVLE